MGLFNKFSKPPKHPEATASQNANINNNWDNLGQSVPFAGAETSQNPDDLAQTSAARQQRKILAGVLYDPQQVISRRDFALSAEQENAALDILCDQDKRLQLEQTFLQNIADPINLPGVTAETLFTKGFSGPAHRQESKILSHMIGNGFDNYANLQPASIYAFLHEYPSPIQFEDASQSFLDSIEQNNSPQKYAEYQRAMHNLKHTIYGKRQEYWEQMQVLNDKAELRDMMQKAEMDADSVPVNGTEFILTPETLEEAGLAPEHLVKIGDREIGLSGVFDIGDRDCAIGYVKDDNGRVKVRGYYQSGSQGIWRYLPDCVCNSDGTGINYYGKGGFKNSEEKVTLPWQLQQKLGALASTKEGRKDREVAAAGPAWKFIAGTARQYGSKYALSDAYTFRTAKNDLYKETTNKPNYQFGIFSGEGEYRRPELVDIQGPESPDFQHEVAGFILPTRKYGPVQMRVFESADGKLEYLFGECEKGAWLTSVQAKSEIGSTGCHKSWVEANDLVTPLYEYSSQSGGYGEPVLGQHYVSMWQGFLSRTPIIQKYLNRHNV